jgi:hypothetical protein
MILFKKYSDGRWSRIAEIDCDKMYLVECLRELSKVVPHQKKRTSFWTYNFAIVIPKAEFISLFTKFPSPEEDPLILYTFELEQYLELAKNGDKIIFLDQARGKIVFKEDENDE